MNHIKSHKIKILTKHCLQSLWITVILKDNIIQNQCSSQMLREKELPKDTSPSLPLLDSVLWKKARTDPHCPWLGYCETNGSALKCRYYQPPVKVALGRAITLGVLNGRRYSMGMLSPSWFILLFCFHTCIHMYSMCVSVCAHMHAGSKADSQYLPGLLSTLFIEAGPHVCTASTLPPEPSPQPRQPYQ